jgi:hypothetical protein
VAADAVAVADPTAVDPTVAALAAAAKAVGQAVMLALARALTVPVKALMVAGKALAKAAATMEMMGMMATKASRATPA